MDPTFCTSLGNEQTVAMALTALSCCVDALLARELALGVGTAPPQDSDVLLQLGTRGIGAVAEGLPAALEDGKNVMARELLTMGSVCAGRLSVITPAPPTQVRQDRACCTWWDLPFACPGTNSNSSATWCENVALFYPPLTSLRAARLTQSLTHSAHGSSCRITAGPT